MGAIPVLSSTAGTYPQVSSGFASIVRGMLFPEPYQCSPSGELRHIHEDYHRWRSVETLPVKPVATESPSRVAPTILRALQTQRRDVCRGAPKRS